MNEEEEEEKKDEFAGVDFGFQAGKRFWIRSRMWAGRCLYQSDQMRIRTIDEKRQDKRFWFVWNEKTRTIESANGGSNSIEIVSEGRDHQTRLNKTNGKWW